MTPEPHPDMAQLADDDRDTVDPDTLRESGRKAARGPAWRGLLSGVAIALFYGLITALSLSVVAVAIGLGVKAGVRDGLLAAWEADRIMHPGAWE